MRYSNTRKITQTRKLVAYPLLSEIAYLRKLGVPLAKIIKDKNLDIKTGTLTNLLKWFENKSVVVQESLFPSWLEQDSVKVQDSPKDWYYRGHFPIGKWEQETLND